MIIVMQPDAGEAEIAAVEARIRAHGLDVHVSRGTERTLIGAIGDERKLDPEMFDPLPGVERSLHILKPYKLVAREWHKASTSSTCAARASAAPTVQVIAGPCSVETAPQMRAAAEAVAAARRAPDARRRVQAAHEPLRVPGQGRRGPRDAEGRGAARTACPIVTELMDVRMLDTFLEHERRRHPDRHAQHAELRPAEGGRRGRRAGHPQARHERDDRRVADGGGVHRGGRQPPHHPVRARHPHVRDRVSQRARRHRDRRC